jgi:hypothetical protein
MSFELFQCFGLGLKIRDIQKFVPEKEEVAVYYPFEVPTGDDVTKEMLIRHGFFEQYAKLAAQPEENPAAVLKSLIETTEEGDDVFVDLKQALHELLQTHKTGDEVKQLEIQSLMYAVIDIYLSLNLEIPNVFEISSSITAVDLGGMAPDEPYLIFRHWSHLEEDGGWHDPRKNAEDKAMMDSMKIALVGEAHPGFQLLTPIFGG